MPRNAGSEPRSRQLLLRLTDDEHEILAAAAYLQGVTPTELAKLQVVAFVKDRGRSDRIQRLLRERREFEAEAAGALTSLAERESRRERDDA